MPTESFKPSKFIYKEKAFGGLIACRLTDFLWSWVALFSKIPTVVRVELQNDFAGLVHRRMVRNGNQLQIFFSADCDTGGLSHVQSFMLHSIGEFPIKMV